MTFFHPILTRIKRRRAQLRFFSVLSAMCLVATAVLTSQVFFKLEEYGKSKSDNIAWSLAQIEVDHVKLVSALERLSPPTPEALKLVRLRFDALYSRVNTYEVSPTYRNALRGTDAARQLNKLQGALQSLIPLIDANDASLLAQQDRIKNTVLALTQSVRALSIDGIGIDAALSMAERETLTAKLIKLTLLSLLLVTTLLSLMWVLWRLYLRYRVRAVENRTTLKRLTTILNTSEDAVLVVRKDGQIVDTNNTARQLFGLYESPDPNTPISANIGDFLWQDDKDGHAVSVPGHALLQACRADSKLPTVMTARRHDGQLVPVEVSANLASRSNDDVCVCFLRDISDRVAAEAEIRAARDKALQGERAKATFLARISHEMRTPLHGIIGSLDLLKQTPLRPDQARFADVMKSSAQILLGQIDDAMGVDRSGGPKLDLSPVPFDLDRLLEDLILSQAPKADARNTALRLIKGDTGLGVVFGDPDRIRQVLLNLIANAIKFTENGHVAVEASRLAADDTTGEMIEFQIADTGIGIAQEDMSRIFDDYVRLSHPMHSTVEGSGLGLGIVRNLVNLMGGQIGAESLEGEGSLFWVRLPLPTVSDASGSAEDTTRETRDGCAQNVLVVEDNAINRFVLERMLLSGGHRVTLAKCGLDGVALAQAQPYDLIIMDVNMPDIDGIEATRRIRKSVDPGRPLRIVALTAYFSDVDRGAMMAAGIDEVWTKPLRLEDMHALLNDLGAQSQAPHISTDTAAKDRPDIITNALGELSTSVPVRRLTAFIDEFTTEGEALLDRLNSKPIEANKNVADKLHKLAGSAAVLGAARAQSLFAHAEEAARRGDLVNLEQAARELAEVLPVTIQSLSDFLADTHQKADSMA